MNTVEVIYDHIIWKILTSVPTWSVIWVDYHVNIWLIYFRKITVTTNFVVKFHGLVDLKTNSKMSVGWADDGTQTPLIPTYHLSLYADPNTNGKCKNNRRHYLKLYQCLTK